MKSRVLAVLFFLGSVLVSLVLISQINRIENFSAVISHFSPRDNSDLQNDPGATTVILGGDIMLGRSVMATSLDRKDPKYPFSRIADFLSEGDIVFVNLENPIVRNCPRLTEGLVFCASPEMLEGLVSSNIKFVSIANNHAFDQGDAGRTETKEHLSKAGINYTGDGELLVYEKNGTTFGFLGFNKAEQTNPVLTESEKDLMMSSRDRVDVLIVSMHWGVEYQSEALPGVKRLAAELVSLGADVVHGHHPHWVQNSERISVSGDFGNSEKNVPVYYSLGNLVFDQMWSEKTRQGLLVKLTFEDGMLVGEEFINTYMEHWAQPRITSE